MINFLHLSSSQFYSFIHCHGNFDSITEIHTYVNQLFYSVLKTFLGFEPHPPVGSKHG